MSLYTRLASTDKQEESVAAVEKAFRKANVPICGYTTIGKAPQTVILDVFKNDSKVYVNAEGTIKIDNVEYERSEVTEMATIIKSIRERKEGYEWAKKQGA